MIRIHGFHGFFPLTERSMELLKGKAATDRAKQREARRKSAMVQLSATSILRRIERQIADENWEAERPASVSAVVREWFDAMEWAYGHGSIEQSVNRLLAVHPAFAMFTSWLRTESRAILGERAPEADLDRLAYRIVSRVEGLEASSSASAR